MPLSSYDEDRRRGRHRQPVARAELSRRRFIAASVIGVTSVGIGYGGYRGVKALVDGPSSLLSQITGSTGTNISGTFYSRFRRQSVGYTVGYPTGHGPGSRLPLVVFMHGYRGTHNNCLAGYSPASATSLRVNGHPLTPMALVTVDGGGGYWHPHPGDDPMGMIVHELIPMMQARGLGRLPHRVATMGISMGGYGAINLAEHRPGLVHAVAAISPAIFASYDHVHYVNPGAYSSPEEFNKYDALTHVAALGHKPVRVASGASDPFHPWVEEFTTQLPSSDPVVYPPGGHDGAFFYTQIAPSMAFLSQHLAT